VAPRRLVIGCGIFESEAAEALRGFSGAEVEIRWLKAGYHVRPELLGRRISEAAASVPPERRGEIRLLLGERCLDDPGPELSGLKTLPTANCLTAILGQERLRELEAGPSLVATPAWVRKIWLARDPELPIWDQAEFRMNFGRYRRIVIVDAGLEPLGELETLAAFDLTGRVIETERADLGLFKRTLWEFLR
jgi:hypothetical protein